MNIYKKLHSLTLVSAAFILFLILVSSAASAVTEQSASSSGPFAYITNSGSSTVSVIDTTTNKITATVPVGQGPDGIAVSPYGKKAYVTDSNGVSVIDTTTNKVTATVPVGSNPIGIAVNSAGTKVYVANAGCYEDIDNNVSVIDTATNTVIATVPVGNCPMGVVVSPNGKKVYVASESDNISVIDTASNIVTDTIPAGHQNFGIAINPAGTKLYVTNFGNNIVSVINTTTNKIVSTVPVGSTPIGVAVNQDGTRVYVTNQDSNTVSVINTATNKVMATVSVGPSPFGIALTPDGKKAYVANSGCKLVSVINTATYTVTTLSVGNYPVSFGQFIGTTSLAPVANFSATPTSGKAPLTVKFTDKSTGSPISWKWSFGDGTISTTKNPTHTYSKAGKYTVEHTVTNAAGSNKITKTSYITVKTAIVKPVAAFSATPTSGNAPLKVQFTDKSTGSPTFWKWSFGDGTTSTSKNPAHTYSKAGKYTVSLTSKNEAGTNTKKITNYITVKTAPVKPVAAFSATPTSGKKPLKVQFTDKSTNSPTSWKWDFGDGTTSTAHNPLHTYIKAGTLTVTLTATNSAGSSTVTKSKYIKVK